MRCEFKNNNAMNKFLFYFISEITPYIFMLIAFWMFVRFVDWLVKTFIPAFKELIRDIREWRAQERSKKTDNKR